MSYFDIIKFCAAVNTMWPSTKNLPWFTNASVPNPRAGLAVVFVVCDVRTVPEVSPVRFLPGVILIAAVVEATPAWSV